jgi:hypothetical protein
MAYFGGFQLKLTRFRRHSTDAGSHSSDVIDLAPAQSFQRWAFFDSEGAALWDTMT